MTNIGSFCEAAVDRWSRELAMHLIDNYSNEPAERESDIRWLKEHIATHFSFRELKNMRLMPDDSFKLIERSLAGRK